MQFLKLRSALINTRHISRIVTQKDKYVLHMDQKSLGGIFSVVFGIISSSDDTFDVCKYLHDEDFETVKKFIEDQPGRAMT